MRRSETQETRADGTTVKRTSVYIRSDLHELVKLAGRSFTDLLEGAILREILGENGDDDNGVWSDSFREKVEKIKDEMIHRLDNRERRMEIVRDQVETIRARAVAEELATQEIERREKDRAEAHKRSLEAAWGRVAEKRYLTPEKVGKWLPMVDTAGDYVDEWEALPTWLSREAGESFTCDEVLTYAKRYAAGDSPPPGPPPGDRPK